MRGALIVAVVVLVAAGWYAVNCWWWPWARCSRCHGGGRKYAPNGKAFRDCRRCRGTGRRVRLGRRLWDWYRQ